MLVGCSRLKKTTHLYHVHMHGDIGITNFTVFVSRSVNGTDTALKPLTQFKLHEF